MSRIGTITRRAFLGVLAAGAGGVAVGYWYASRPYANPLENSLGEGEATFNPYVRIGADNTIAVIAPRAEMGQGISTTLAAMVAEELNVRLDQVKIEHGPADFAYFNATMLAEGGPFAFYNDGMMAGAMRGAMGTMGKVLGLQGTGGSASARDGFDKMREAGAAARQMLVAAAAIRLGVAESELSAREGTISHPGSGRSVRYGDVAAEAAKLPSPATVTLKDKSAWTILGKPQRRADMLAKVTGAPIFGIDTVLPDMLFGTVRMSPRFWAGIVKADTAKAEAMPGVVKIVRLDTTYGSGFGIIAKNTWAAFNAAEAIEVEWGAAEYPADAAAQQAALETALATNDGWKLRNDGDVDTAFADAPRNRIVSADYSAPYLAHACMEPMNATARLKDGVLDLWSPNQMPTITRQLCAAALDIERDAVNVHTTFLGGGFGRRGEMDFSIYAALLAREAGGRPVKVTWTRAEDTTHGPYRPAAVARMEARLGEDGMPKAIDIKVASPSTMASTMRRTFPSLSPMGPDKTIAEGSFDQPYHVDDYRVTAITAPDGVPVGFWRSVGNSFNGFFHEGFLDELATAGGKDPIDMRVAMMAQFPTAIGVMRKLAEISGWSQPLPPGKGRGVAFTLSFGSWVGEVVQVADTPDGIRIEKMWIVADVGTALDPGIIEAQLMSAAIFGLSAAIGQEITFADGMVQQSNFHDYDAMRMSQCPQVEIAILETAEKMGGVGEIGTPPAAPALANAIFSLTGKRIRSLPLSRAVSFV